METTFRITNLEQLRQEKARVKLRLEQRRKDFSHKMYEIPAELAAAGANSLIPSFLRGKVTNAALSGGKKLINGLMLPGENSGHNLPKVVKGIGLLGKVIRLFRK